MFVLLSCDPSIKELRQRVTGGNASGIKVRGPPKVRPQHKTLVNKQSRSLSCARDHAERAALLSFLECFSEEGHAAPVCSAHESAARRKRILHSEIQHIMEVLFMINNYLFVLSFMLNSSPAFAALDDFSFVRSNVCI